jgi:hypothetical protein
VSELADLLSAGPPSFHLTEASAATLGTAALTRDRPTVAVRRLRGSHSRTAKAFFDELAAALQFPAYFGANWNAVRDMLSDLRWLPAEAYLLIVEDADQLLADEADAVLTVGLNVLAESAASAAPVPFQFVLQTAADSRVAKALGTNGTPYETVVL